ncbi:hypothetical protein EV191_1011078 [Tamaricihabitans halophyticus]|uniref:Uncharacterized protein n=1 Tax=Tamaricihabitans halophyticus TaxID=1262583 RepID=A0A4V2SV79_9PSEU|nr:hypothetical protein [Tamaricihabitans halophyticus]TCP57126.1 hypothetical protein EV191_1011078 [Tamaricihabitans halophyticus]
MSRKIFAGTLGALALAVATLGIAAPAASAAPAKLSHSEATAKLEDAGIKWQSSGNCSDRDQPNCTSFEQVNEATIDGIIDFKGSSDCALTLTGGTETGHADGTHSHWNGYKVDFSPTSCTADYIRGNFSEVDSPAWGSEQWKDDSGNLYTLEGNHWDVTYY